jgi:hypothetical protein
MPKIGLLENFRGLPSLQRLQQLQKQEAVQVCGP